MPQQHHADAELNLHDHYLEESNLETAEATVFRYDPKSF